MISLIEQATIAANVHRFKVLVAALSEEQAKEQLMLMYRELIEMEVRRKREIGERWGILQKREGDRE